MSGAISRSVPVPRHRAAVLASTLGGRFTVKLPQWRSQRVLHGFLPKLALLGTVFSALKRRKRDMKRKKTNRFEVKNDHILC